MERFRLQKYLEIHSSNLRKDKLQKNDQESHMAAILNVFDRLNLRGHFQ